MRCEEFEKTLFEGGEVSEAMRAHAENCEACRVLLEHADVLSGSAQLDEDVQLPPSFTAGWRAAVRREAAKGRAPGAWEKMAAWFGGFAGQKPALAFALCAVVLVGVGFAGGRLQGGADLPAQNRVMSYSARSMRTMASDTSSAAGLGASFDAMEDTALADEAGVQRKIIYTAQMDVRVEDMDAALAEIEAQVSAAGGTIGYCEKSGQKGEGRYATLEARVPSQQLSGFMSAAGMLGMVTREVRSQDDVTAQYMDNASRLESALAQKQRLDELYAQAQDMTDIVTITDAIFEVQQEIDSLSGQNAWIDDRAAFARVTFSLYEPADEPQEETPGFFARVAQSFMGGFAAIAALFGSVVLFAAWALPWCALLAAAAAAAYGIARFVKRR